MKRSVAFLRTGACTTINVWPFHCRSNYVQPVSLPVLSSIKNSRQFPASRQSQQALAKTDAHYSCTSAAFCPYFSNCENLGVEALGLLRMRAGRPAEICVNHVETKVSRMWERSAFLSQRNIDVCRHELVLECLKPVLQHWVAELSQIAAHAETLMRMPWRRRRFLNRCQDVFTPPRASPTAVTAVHPCELCPVKPTIDC